MLEGLTANGNDNFARQNRHASLRKAAPPQNIGENFLTQQYQSNLSNNNSHNDLQSIARGASISSSHVAVTNQVQSHFNGRGVTVVEPRSNCTTPALALNNLPKLSDTLTASNSNADDNLNHTHTHGNSLVDSTQNLLQLNTMLSGHGRASAPPQLFVSQSGGLIPNTKVFQENQKHTMHRHPRGRVVNRNVNVNNAQQHVMDGRTPVPSFNNSPSQFAVKLPPSSTPVPIPAVEDPAFKELAPFLIELSNANGKSKAKDVYPSRALAIFGLSGLQLSEVKSTCEAFGSLLYFRSEFFRSNGVLLIAYHDLRSSRHAAGELRTYLKQMIAGLNDTGIQLSANTYDIKVHYCVSLTSSYERDGSTLVISSLPPHITHQDVSDLLASTYGALRSISSEASGCVIVEFYDIQDADQAIVEMQSAKPWGASTSVSSKMRQDYERSRGKDLLALIGVWRKNSKQKGSQTTPPPFINEQNPVENNVPTSISAQMQSSGSSPALSNDSSRQTGMNTQSTASTGAQPAVIFQPTPQLIVGPDGQYQYVMVQPQSYPTAPQNFHSVVNPQYGAVMQQMQPTQQHVVPGTHSTYVSNPYDGQGYWVQQTHHGMQNVSGSQCLPGSSNHSVISHQPVVEMHPGQSIPMYAPILSHSQVVDSSISSGNTSSCKRSPVRAKEDNNNNHLALDIDIVKNGNDLRTSLMVRNIPNKYTQSMLLSEFQDSGHGPGKIDFFYLPIDFRNKCNRGYAFINFVDHADIVSFYDTYNGKHWKIFKSEKICCITYARIQGKDSMMKRFQNSALMEKDQEFRPLVFAPNGDVA